jgi:hypothetical protein
MTALALLSWTVLVAFGFFFVGMAVEDTGLNPCLQPDVLDQQFNVLGGYVVCDGRGLLP